MHTAYKSRLFWIMTALDYFDSPANFEEACEAARGSSYPCPTITQSRAQQLSIWGQQGAKAARNAVAPEGAECLTRRYVDAQGHTLPEFLAA